MRKEGIERRFLLAAASAAESVARIVADAPEPVDLVVTSPTPFARRAVRVALDGRWAFTVEDPLLAPRAPAESGGDVIARLVQALRALRAYDANAPLVLCDSLDILGAAVFELDELGLERATDRLEALLPLP